MTEIYDFHAGSTPLLVSMPHSGTDLPPALRPRLSAPARALPDTDWHVPRLYDFLDEFDASIIRARYSRYLIDLNRPPDDAALYPGQASTGLCPDALFDGRALYADGAAVPASEVEQRRERYWRPYHERLAAELERIRDRHGYAILFDAHSIAARVPRLFPGRLPDLNLGTVGGTSCGKGIEAAAAEAIAASGFSHVVNGRFVGGYITRHYGAPRRGVHALQLELSQATYMDGGPSFAYDPRRAEKLRHALRRVFTALLAAPAGTGARQEMHSR